MRSPERRRRRRDFSFLYQMFCSCGHLMHQSKSDHLLLLKVLVCCWQAQIWCHRHFSVSTRTVFQQVSYDEHFQSPAVSLPVLIQTKQTQLESVFVLLAVTSSATGYILQFIWKPLFAYGASLKKQTVSAGYSRPQQADVSKPCCVFKQAQRL